MPPRSKRAETSADTSRLKRHRADGRRVAPTMPRTEAADRAPEFRDLRLLPLAATAWFTCLLAVVLSPALSAALALMTAGATLLLALRALKHHTPRHRFDPRPGTRSSTQARGPLSATLALCALVATLCLALTGLENHQRLEDPIHAAAQQGKSVELIATVTSTPRVVGSRGHVRMYATLAVRSVDGQPSDAEVRVLGHHSWRQIPFGATIRIETSLKATEPGERSQALISGQAKPYLLAEPSGLLGWVQRLREGLLTVTGREPTRPGSGQLPPGSHALVPGIALGDDSALPPEVRENMRTLSLTHLTAVSGQHVALVVGLVLTMFSTLPRHWRALAALAVLIALVILVRPSGSVLRAGVMGGVLIIGVALGRQAASLPALCLAMTGLVLADPWQARDYGFILSVLATAGIVLGQARLHAVLSRFLPSWLAQVCAVPIVAQLACAPVLVLLQPQLSLWSVPANIVAAIPVGPTTILALAATLVAPLWAGGAALLAKPALWGSAWIAGVAQFGSRLPGSSLPWVEGPAGAVLLAALHLGAIIALVLWSRRRHRASTARRWWRGNSGPPDMAR